MYRHPYPRTARNHPMRPKIAPTALPNLVLPTEPGTPAPPEHSQRFHPVIRHGVSLTHLLKETRIKELAYLSRTEAEAVRG
jgi:hypothetical protein